MPKPYVDTLTALCKFAGGATVPDLGHPDQPSAITNRLTRLERWGYVAKDGKRGKFTLWRQTVLGLKTTLPTKLKRCFECGETPEWRLHGDSFRLAHSSPGHCPNTQVILDTTPTKIAKTWNAKGWDATRRPRR